MNNTCCLGDKWQLPTLMRTERTRDFSRNMMVIIKAEDEEDRVAFSNGKTRALEPIQIRPSTKAFTYMLQREQAAQQGNLQNRH